MAELAELALPDTRHLPASVAFLSKESIALFTKFRASSHETLHIKLARDGRFHIHVDGGYEMAFAWPHSLPERAKVESIARTSWLMPVTDTFALAVMLAWDSEQIVYGDDDARVQMEILKSQIVLGELSARAQAEYKLLGNVPAHNFYYNESLPPTDYQQVAAFCAMKGLDGYGLTMKQGTGKTPVVILRVCNECEEVYNAEGRMYRAIVVTPNNVRLNWVTEFKRFATHPLRVTVVRGNEIERIKQVCDAFRDQGDGALGTVVVVSYDTLAVMWPVMSVLDWDLAALDEAHYIKSVKTRRFKTCIQLRDRSRSRMIMTGTPVANTPLDLYAMLEFLGRGYSGFSSHKAFCKFYGKYRMDPNHGPILTGSQENHLPILQERLARLTFSISLKEALPELPDKVYDIIECEMTNEQRKLYEKVAREVEIQIEQEMEKGESSGRSSMLVVNNVLTMMLKLSQVTSGFLNFPEMRDEHGNIVQEEHVQVITPNPKVEMLVETLKEKEPHEKTLVWACYTHDIEAIYEQLIAAGIGCVRYYGATSDNDREYAEWAYNNDPNCRVLIGNAAAGGTGLNLLGYPPHTKDPATYTTHAIYYSQGWSYIHRDQSEARGHRLGTLHNVRISDLVIPGTIDEEIRVRVFDKKAVALTVGELRPILQRILAVLHT